MKKISEEDRRYRQGRSLRQVEDSEMIIAWTFTVATISLVVGLLAHMILS